MGSLIGLLSACGQAYAVTECKGVVQSYFTNTGSAQGTSATIWGVMPNDCSGISCRAMRTARTFWRD